jgi:hypothetical protein
MVFGFTTRFGSIASVRSPAGFGNATSCIRAVRAGKKAYRDATNSNHVAVQITDDWGRQGPGKEFILADRFIDDQCIYLFPLRGGSND